MKETQRVNGGTNLETTGRIGQKGIGRVAMMYKSFGIRMYSTMLASAKQMIDKHQDPTVRAIAFRQLVGVTGSSIFFAGVRGFPLYGAFIVAANMIKDDDEEDAETMVRKYVKEGFYKGPLTYITGMDVSSRVALSGLLLQVNRYNHDPSPEEAIGFYLGGPALSTGKRFFRGATDFADGEMQRGVESMLPAAFSNAMKGVGRYASEGARTRRGDPIFDDMNFGDLAGQVIGFAPVEYTFRQEQNMQTKKLERVLVAERQKLTRKYYYFLRNGNQIGVNKVKEKIEDWNSGLPRSAKDLKITRKTIAESLKRHRRTSSEMYNGVTINPLARKYLEELREEYDQGFQLY